LAGPIETEVNAPNDINVRDLPSLNELAVTFFPENSVGRSFRFQIKVWTTQREALSAVNFIELASIPGKPPAVPQIV
jgi:hypothetical protein